MNIDKENSGLLFAVDKKSDNSPDYRGQLNVDGVQYEIALWEKEFSKGGAGFTAKLSEPFEPKRTARSEKIVPKARPKGYGGGGASSARGEASVEDTY